MSGTTQISANAIAHLSSAEGTPNVVTYTATTENSYGKLRFSTDGGNSAGVWLDSVAKIDGLATPTLDNHAANKKYVDDQVSMASAGLDAKDSVAYATTTNLDLSAPGSTFDGVTVTTNGIRILVKDQTDASENGIYTWQGASNAMVRAADMDEATEVAGAYVFVQAGNTYGGQGWVVTSPLDGSNVIPGTTDISWTQFSGATAIADGSVTNDMLAGNIANGKLANDSITIAGQVTALGGNITADTIAGQISAGTVTVAQTALTAGDGLSISGNSIALDLHATPGLEHDGAQLRVKAHNGVAISADGLAVDIHETSPSLEIFENKLRLQVKPSAGLERTATGVGIAETSVTNAMLGGNITHDKLAGSIPVNKTNLSGGDGLAISGDSVAVDLHATDPALEFHENKLRLQVKPSAGLERTATGVGIAETSVTNAMLAGSIAYGKLSLTGALQNTDFADNAISGDKINGGTIDAITINSLSSGTVDIDGGNIDGTIIGGTTPAAGTFTQVSSTSDARLKEDIQTIEPEEALRVIRESRGVTFRFKKECGGYEGAGVVAQEADKVLPRVVSKRVCRQTGLKDRHAVDYQSYFGYVLAANKEMLRRLEEVEGCCRKRKRCDEEEGVAAKKSR